MTMRIDVANLDEIYSVAARMRDSDYAEFSAVNTGNTRRELAEMLAIRYSAIPGVLCVHSDSRPVGIGGALELRPNVLTLLFFATDEFATIALPLTRFIKRRLFPPLVAAGAHRIECVSMEGHTAAHRWIAALGLSQETAPMKGYGRNGESFTQFAWVADVCPARA